MSYTFLFLMKYIHLNLRHTHDHNFEHLESSIDLKMKEVV